MRTVFNFSAGPAVLPEEVLRQAAEEMLDWHGSGQSVMEMSHRGKEYMSIHAQAEADLRELMGIPVELQGAVPAGRRHAAVRDGSDEPAARQGRRRLREHRRVVEEGDQGGQAPTARSTSPRAPRTGTSPTCRRRSDWKLDAERRLCPHLRERDDRRRRVQLDARHRQRAAGGRHVVDVPVAPDRRLATSA